MPTANLALPYLAGGSGSRSAQADAALDALDAALTGRLDVDLTTGDVNLTVAEFTRHVCFRAVDLGGVARTLHLPATRQRQVLVDHAAAAGDLTVRVGAGLAVAVQPGELVLLWSDGTDVVAVNEPAAAAYDLPGMYLGRPPAGVVLVRLPILRAFTLPTDLAGSHALAEVAAAAETVLTWQRNDAPFATMTWATGEANAVLAGDATSFTPGDDLTLMGPGAMDATLENLAWALAGTLD
jgi:hypothetical protein